MYIYENEIRTAARVVIEGGIGFVRLPPHCDRAATKALRHLTKLGKVRKRLGAKWNDSEWGYEPDDRKQFDRGLSQWRPDERKSVFHYRPDVPETLQGLGAPVENWDGLFSSCLKIYKAVEEVGLLFAAEFDRILPGYGFEQTCREGIYRNILRLLSYERRNEGETIAADPHRDRSFISLHVSETAPGLFFGTDTESRTRVSGPPLYMAVFPGRKFQQMTNGRVKALYHGTEEIPEMEPDGRRASVFFLHSNTDLVREKGELVF